MISLHGGRLLLFCDRADKTWHCRISIGPRAEHRSEYDTGTIQLQVALQRAQSFYDAATARHRQIGDPPKCWYCRHWDVRRRNCDLGFPESRQSGGRYAARCEVYVHIDSR